MQNLSRLVVVVAIGLAACAVGSDRGPSTTVAASTTSEPPAPISVSSTVTTAPGVVEPSTTPEPAYSDSREGRWSEDIDFLFSVLDERHPDAFHRSSRGAFAAQVAGLKAAIAQMTDAEMEAEVIRLAAEVDGHSFVWPYGEAVGHRAYPLKLYEFADGTHVVAAADPALVGARLVAIGGVPLDEVRRRLEPYVARDNASTVAFLMPAFLIDADLLELVGVGAVDSTTFAFESAGDAVDATPMAVDRSTWSDLVGDDSMVLLPQDSASLTRSHHRDAAFWWRRIDGGDTVYIQYNQTTSDGYDDRREWNSLRDLVAEVSESIDEAPAGRVVLDLGYNSGGNNRTYRPLLELMRDPRIDRQGALFVVTGRQTFSAAANLSTELEQTTTALFVGEAMGGSPNLFGDARTATLPHSGIELRYSTRLWVVSDPGDTRLTIEPHLPVGLTYDQFAAGGDPVLEAILAAAP